MIAAFTQMSLPQSNSTPYLLNLSQNPATSVEGATVSPGVVIPQQAKTWFNIDTIHQIEKKALSDFFDAKTPSKTPEM